MTPFSLRPVTVEELAAIDNPFSKYKFLSDDWRLNVLVEYGENWNLLSEETQIAIYRMAQHQYQNENRPRN